ncbi:MAG: hypothetical protein ACLPVW_05735 [Terriglobales bacterium]
MRLIVIIKEGPSQESAHSVEWVRTWAKRTIIQSALSALQPHPRHHADSSWPGRALNINDLWNIPDRDVALGTVWALEDFERFVFVLTVLAGYSEHDCALLLNSSIGDVRNARIQATEQLAAAESRPIVASHGSTRGQMESGTNVSLSEPREI